MSQFGVLAVIPANAGIHPANRGTGPRVGVRGDGLQGPSVAPKLEHYLVLAHRAYFTTRTGFSVRSTTRWDTLPPRIP